MSEETNPVLGQPGLDSDRLLEQWIQKDRGEKRCFSPLLFTCFSPAGFRCRVLPG